MKPVSAKRIFWDMNFEQIDYDAKANFVIERVFERGDVEDIRQCRRYYGNEKVTAALLHAGFTYNHFPALSVRYMPVGDTSASTLN